MGPIKTFKKDLINLYSALCTPNHPTKLTINPTLTPPLSLIQIHSLTKWKFHLSAVAIEYAMCHLQKKGSLKVITFCQFDWPVITHIPGELRHWQSAIRCCQLCCPSPDEAIPDMYGVNSLSLKLIQNGVGSNTSGCY